jgi:hypothetical protein
MSKSRIIAGNLGASSGASSGGGVTIYANSAALPTSGNTAGDLAFTTDKKGMFNWDGAAWDRIYSGANEVPSWDSALPGVLTLKANGETSIIKFKAASDIEGFPINYTYETVPSYPAQLDSAFGQDSASGGSGILDSTNHPTEPRITLKPSVRDSDGGDFTLRIKANDGSHVITSSSTVSLSFYEGDYFYVANSTYAASKDTVGVTADTYQGSAVSLGTVGGYQGHYGGKTQAQSGGNVNNALVWDLTNTGGFDASTDLIVFSMWIPNETGTGIGIGVYDNAAAKSITLATTSSTGLGRLDGNMGLFSNWDNDGEWIMAIWGGGNAIATINNTTSSGFRMWPAQTGGTTTLGTEIGSGLGTGGGYTPPTVSQPGMVFWNGGDAGSYTAGYTSRTALEWYVRSFQVYYNQTTSGRTVEQIVGAHQKLVFA